MALYSTIGLTRALYACSLDLAEHVRRLRRSEVCSLQPLHKPVRVSLSKPLATMYEKQIQCSDCDLFSELPVVLFFFVWFIFKGRLIPFYKP